MTNQVKHVIDKFKLKPSHEGELPIKIPDTTRQDLVQLFSELGYSIGAEIGVERGVFSEEMCKANPDLKLYCIDAWESYEENEGYSSQRQLDRYYAQAQERLALYNCTFIKKRSDEAAKEFSEDSLDFVYLDANHNFDYVMRDIIDWSPKVRAGGIVSGHDYVANNLSHTFKYGVIEATAAYTRAHGITPWFLLDGERSASWFWVKL